MVRAPQALAPALAQQELEQRVWGWQWMWWMIKIQAAGVPAEVALAVPKALA